LSRDGRAEESGIRRDRVCPLSTLETTNESFRALIDRLLDGSLPLEFHYQPIVDLRRACVVGYEALVRLPAEIGMPTEQCLQAAAECGKRLELEAAMFRTALRAREFLPPNCFLSANVSPLFLVSRQWDAFVAAETNLTGLVVEITEQDVIADYAAVRRRVDALKLLGGMIAIDDIGTGYASLKHVTELRPNFVKLDRFFVDRCPNDRSKATFIEMIGTATERLDAWIIAEGVETRAELDELIRLGVPLAQGYYLGRPKAAMKPLCAVRAGEVRSSLRARVRTETMEAHADVCLRCASRAEGAAMLEMHAEVDLAVRVDLWQRPLEFIERHPAMGVRWLEEMMKVQVGSRPVDALQRALARRAACRFDPIAVINEQGGFEGAVRIDRLMRGILDAAPLAERASQFSGPHVESDRH